MKTPACLMAIALLAGCASNGWFSETDSLYQNAFVSPGTKFAGLPPPVQNTIRAQVGATEITDIVRFTNSSGIITKAWFTPAEINPPLYVAADGSVLNPDLTVAMGAPADRFDVVTGREVSDLRVKDLLPPEVISAIETRIPLTEITRITRQPWGARNVYVIYFKDPERNPTLYVTSEGTVLKDSPR